MSVEQSAAAAIEDRYVGEATMKSVVHDSHLYEALDQELLDHLTSIDDLNARLWFSLVRERHPETALTLSKIAADGGSKSRILRWLTLQGEDATATYALLADLTGTGRRNVKRHVAELRDENLLEVDDGRPAHVRLASATVFVLATDTFALYDDANGLSTPSPA